MEGVLFTCAGICILAIIGSRFSGKMGVPGLLVFIFLGMLFGVDGLFKISFDDFLITERISTVALMFIMFYGGFGTNCQEARAVILPSVLLSTAGVFITACITGVFACWILRCSFLEGLLLGSVVASTDAASVFSILRLKKLNLTGGLASVLEIESGSNDPFAYMMTTVILGVMSLSLEGAVPFLVLRQIAWGIAGGVFIGMAAVAFLKKVNMAEYGMHYLFLLAVVLLAYVLPVYVGGNGFLSVYLAGVLIGNQKFSRKIDLVHFFDGVTGAMQLVLFFLLGLLANPSELLPLLLPSLCIAAFLTLVARPAALFTLLAPFHFSGRAKLFLSFAGLRGAASIVFAIYTVISPAYTKNDIFHIVFCIAILSVGIQGTLLPWAAKKLDLLDDQVDVSSTFNDYQKETDMTLIEVRLKSGHPWIEKDVRDIALPAGMLAVMVKRQGDTLIPHGDTRLQASDIVILSCLNYVDHSEIQLYEITMDAKHPWRDKRICELKMAKGQLIVMIKREEEYIIPDGNTRLALQDTLVICEDTARI